MPVGRPRTHQVTDEMLPPGRILALSEIGEPEPIEMVAANNLIQEAELEAFMNEIVTIRMHQSPVEGALAVETVALNGVNMPIIRGINQPIKRKYVEILAQSRAIMYSQVQQNPADLSDIAMVERPALAYPFEVIHDPNPKGRAWLENILASD